MTASDAWSRLVTGARGQALGLAELGDPAGAPVFYCHGLPSCRLEAVFAHEAATRAGVRLLALDRPGMGLSPFQPGRAITDWPADAAAVADALGVQRFTIAGVSGGAPYALAAACALPDRVQRVMLLAGVAPMAGAGAVPVPGRLRAALTLARRCPALPRAALGLAATWSRLHRRSFVRQVLFRVLDAPDRALLREPAREALLHAMIGGAYAQGAQGAAWEVLLLARPWGFDPRRLTQPVTLWHGEADSVVPVALGRRMAAQLPGCEAHILPGEGHFSIGLRHMARILADLTDPAQRKTSCPRGCGNAESGWCRPARSSRGCRCGPA